MSKTHKEEFQHDLGFALLQHLRANDMVIAQRDIDGTALSGFNETEDTATEALRERVKAIVEALTADWSVEKGRPSSHDHPLYDGPDKIRFKIRTPARELNDAEKAAKQAMTDRYRWVHGHDQSTPPPESVDFVELLRQQVWWDHQTRLVDMTPGERLRAMKFLMSNPIKLHRASAFRFAGCPDDGLVEQFLDEDPAEWLKTEPLVQKLAELIKADEKRPCLLRWGGHDGTVDEEQVQDACPSSGDYRHQCDRKHSHTKPHRCLFCRIEQGRTPEDTPPPADAKLSDLLDQGIWWITKKGEQLKLVDMEPSHRANSLAYLRRNAERLVVQAYGGYMADAPQEVQVAFAKGDPWDILAETPLVKNLALLVAHDGATTHVAAVKELFPVEAAATGVTVQQETAARFMDLGATKRFEETKNTDDLPTRIARGDFGTGDELTNEDIH